MKMIIINAVFYLGNCDEKYDEVTTFPFSIFVGPNELSSLILGGVVLFYLVLDSGGS